MSLGGNNTFKNKLIKILKVEPNAKKNQKKENDAKKKA